MTLYSSPSDGENRNAPFIKQVLAPAGEHELCQGDHVNKIGDDRNTQHPPPPKKSCLPFPYARSQTLKAPVPAEKTPEHRCIVSPRAARRGFGPVAPAAAAGTQPCPASGVKRSRARARRRRVPLCHRAEVDAQEERALLRKRSRGGWREVSLGVSPTQARLEKARQGTCTQAFRSCGLATSLRALAHRAVLARLQRCVFRALHAVQHEHERILPQEGVELEMALGHVLLEGGRGGGEAGKRGREVRKDAARVKESKRAQSAKGRSKKRGRGALGGRARS